MPKATKPKKPRTVYRDGVYNNKDKMYGCTLCPDFQTQRLPDRLNAKGKSVTINLEKHVKKKHPEVSHKWEELKVEKGHKGRKNENTGAMREIKKAGEMTVEDGDEDDDDTDDSEEEETSASVSQIDTDTASTQANADLFMAEGYQAQDQAGQNNNVSPTTTLTSATAFPFLPIDPALSHPRPIEIDGDWYHVMSDGPLRPVQSLMTTLRHL